MLSSLLFIVVLSLRCAMAATKKAFDLLVIGAGSGGVRASRIAASYGARVGLCELQTRHGPPHYAAVGGTCVNVGCVPKKLMMFGSQFPDAFQLARSYGWDFLGDASASSAAVERLLTPDWTEFMRRKDREITRLNEVYGKMLAGAGVELLDGHGSLLDANTVKVGDGIYTADKILVSVGAWPFKPPFPGVEHTVTSNEMFYLDEVPKRLTVVGGGYIAVEFASIMKGYGSEVTIVHRGSELLRGFDMDLRKQLGVELQRSGIDVRLQSTPASVEKNSDGTLRMSLTSSSSSNADGTGGEAAQLDADVIMCATGRVPNTKGLGLENAGVELDEAGAVIVDEASCTTAPGRTVFAVGDVTNRVNLTPVALHEGHCFADKEFGGMEDRMPGYETIPAAVFSNPPLATVGMTQEEAVAEIEDVTVFKTSFRPMMNTLTKPPTDLSTASPVDVADAERFFEQQTLMKLVVDTATDRVLGAHMLGPDSAEIIQGLAVAMKAGATKRHFDSTIGVHPSAAEEFVTMRTPHSRFVRGIQQE